MSELLDTPAGIDQRLKQIFNAVFQAQKDLRDARTAEADADVALKRARIIAFHSPDCPKVTRGGYTVADRDAWVDQQSLEQWEAHRRAVAARESAHDYVRALSTQSDILRTLNTSMRTALGLAGVA